MKSKDSIKNQTYAIIKGFVIGFARNASHTDDPCTDYRKEIFSVIDTYFPMESKMDMIINEDTNSSLKEFFEQIVSKATPKRIDERLCINKYLNQTSEQMDFPKQRCEHCNGYGTYDHIIPKGAYGNNDPEKDTYQVSFCPKYSEIGDKINDLGDLVEDNDSN